MVGKPEVHAGLLAGNLPQHRNHIAKIEIAVVEARRSHADEARFRRLYRLARIRGGSQPLGTNGLLNEFWYARLADRRFPRVDGSYLLGRYVDGDDLVAILDHTCSQDSADVSDAED